MKIDLIKAILPALCVDIVGLWSAFTGKHGDQEDVLNKIPGDLPKRDSRAASLSVSIPETVPIYDTTQMAYTIQPYQIAYFSQNEWGETPSQMIQPLIVQAIQNTNYFGVVVSQPHFGRHTYALRTETWSSSKTSLELATLNPPCAPAESRQRTVIIATKKNYRYGNLCWKTPYAGVVAANEATAKLLLELARFIVETAD